MKTTIPRTRKARMKTPLPTYQQLVQDMSFDPGEPFTVDPFEPWMLDEAYPPSFGELVGTLSQEEKSDAEPGAAQTLGGGEPVSSGPQDGDQVGEGGQDRVFGDAGGASPVPQ